MLAEQLGFRYTYPSSDSLAHSTRCLLYEDQDDDSNESHKAAGDPGQGQPPSTHPSLPREVVVKACPRGIEAALLQALGKLYDTCEVVEATPGGSAVWQRLPGLPMNPRHPGLLPLLAVCRSPDGRLYLVSEYFPHNLLTLLHFSSQSLLESSMLGRMSRESVMDLRLFFLFYQLVSTGMGGGKKAEQNGRRKDRKHGVCIYLRFLPSTKPSIPHFLPPSLPSLSSPRCVSSPSTTTSTGNPSETYP